MFGLSNAVIADIRGVLARHNAVERAVIFGSRALGTYREGSDIDLALFGEGLSHRELLDIGAELDDLELLYGVDLVNYAAVADRPVGHAIATSGIDFYLRDCGGDKSSTPPVL